jgi:hypothetical protein
MKKQILDCQKAQEDFGERDQWMRRDGWVGVDWVKGEAGLCAYSHIERSSVKFNTYKAFYVNYAFPLPWLPLPHWIQYAFDSHLHRFSGATDFIFAPPFSHACAYIRMIILVSSSRYCHGLVVRILLYRECGIFQPLIQQWIVIPM